MLLNNKWVITQKYASQGHKMMRIMRWYDVCQYSREFYWGINKFIIFGGNI